MNTTNSPSEVGETFTRTSEILRNSVHPGSIDSANDIRERPLHLLLIVKYPNAKRSDISIDCYTPADDPELEPII